MKIVDFENEPLQNMGFKKETLIVMSRSKKIIVLDKLIDDLWLKWFFNKLYKEMQKNDKLEQIYSSDFVYEIKQCFIREIYQFRKRGNKGINLIVSPIPKEPDESFDDDITIAFGTTNERFRITSEELNFILGFLNHIIEKYREKRAFGIEEKFFCQIRDVFEEDLVLGMLETPYFKVEVVEGWELG